MYESFYGLHERPFDLSPNPRFLFHSNGHRAGLTHLKYGLTGRPGLTVITGEVGTGKTMLVTAALQSIDSQETQIVQLSNPTLTRKEFYEYLAAGFGFTAAAAESKAQFLRELEEAIATHAEHKIVMALIVDEAQSLPHELLEEIRLLTNVESGDRSLTVALLGQPELDARLNQAALRQLKQRITVRCELMPLDLDETAAYITRRVRVAGGAGETLFTRDAIQAIHSSSGGIPRTINVVCDNTLVNGFATDTRPVGRDLVLEVCRDLRLGLPARWRPAPPAPAPLRSGSSSPEPAEAVVSEPARATVTEAGQAADQREPLFNGFSRRRRFSFFEG